MFIIICLLLFASNLFSSSTTKKFPFNHFYKYPLKILESDELDSLKRKLRFSKGTPLEFLLVTKNEISKYTIDGRKSAASLLKKATQHYPNDPNLFLAYAILLNYQGFISRSEDYFLETLELDSTNAIPSYYLGNIYLDKMQKLQNKVSSASFSITYDDYVLDYYDKAQKSLKNCINLGFIDDEVTASLFWLYFDSGNYSEAKKVIGEYIQSTENNWQLASLAGMASYYLKEYEESEYYFNLVFEHVPEDILPVFTESKEYILPQDLLVAEKKYATADPFFMTAYNERELCHNARVIYAQNKYSLKKFNIEGWKSDRGKVFIRYGFPQEIYKIPGELSGGELIVPTIIWTYPGFQLQFADYMMNGNYRFAEPSMFSSGLKTRTMAINSLVAENVFYEKNDEYNFSTAGGEADSKARIIDKRDNYNRNKFSINWQLSNLTEIQNWRFVLFESNYFNIKTIGEWSIENIDKYYNKNLAWYLNSDIVISSKEDNKFKGILEGYNEKEKQFIRIPFNKDIVNYNIDSLFVSDISMGLLYKNKSPSVEFIQIPDYKFKKNKPIVIAFHLANIEYNKNKENSISVEYVVRPDVDSSIWIDVLNIFYKRNGAGSSISIINEYQAKSEKEQISFVLIPDNLVVGDYILEIIIVEENTNRFVNRSTTFSIEP